MNYNKEQLNSEIFKFSKPEYYEEDRTNNVDAGHYSTLDDKQKEYNKKLKFLQLIGAADSYGFVNVDYDDIATEDENYINTFANIESQ